MCLTSHSRKDPWEHPFVWPRLVTAHQAQKHTNCIVLFPLTDGKCMMMRMCLCVCFSSTSHGKPSQPVCFAFLVQGLRLRHHQAFIVLIITSLSLYFSPSPALSVQSTSHSSSMIHNSQPSHPLHHLWSTRDGHFDHSWRVLHWIIDLAVLSGSLHAG